MYFVYVLLNPSGRIYVGQTNQLEERVRQHNDPANDISKYTKRYSGPWKLIHSERFMTRSESMAREKALKSGKGREWIHQHLLPRASG